MNLQLSLQKRLLIAFVGMSVLVILASAATFIFSRSVNYTFTTTQAGFNQIQSLAGLQRNSQDVSVSIDRLFQTRQVELGKERLSVTLREFNSELEKIHRSLVVTSPEKNTENQAILKEIQLITTGMGETVAEIVRLAGDGQWSIAQDMRETVLTTQQSALNNQMSKLSQNIEADVQGTYLMAGRSQNLTRTIAITITILAIIIAGLFGLRSTRSIINPLNQLIKVVQRVTLRDFSPVTPLPQKDEVGDLSRSVALMTDWLRQSYESLEERVAERTSELERQNLKIQVAAEIARDASSARDLVNLLNQAVNLIVSRFGFYHAGIFLLDENHEYAVLQSASGPSSQEMIESGHKLKVGEVGIVGNVAGSGKARIALDVGEDAVHFQNPLLPGTRSEIALPMKVGDLVLGVLDVQSEFAAAFKDDDIYVLQILSDLLAVGIHNARLNTEIQESYLELETLYGQYSQNAWRKVTHTHEIHGYQYDKNGTHPISGTASNGKHSPEETQPDTIIALKVRGESIGTLKIWAGENHFLPEDVTLLEDLAARISQSLDSARLFTETQHRAEYERLANQAASRMRESLDVESVLKSAAEDIYQVLKLDQLTIDLSVLDPWAKENGLSEEIIER